MFWDKRPEDIELGVEMTGPDIREDKVEKAMRRMKGGKVVDENGMARCCLLLIVLVLKR